MPRISAGLLMYRLRGGAPEFLLVHPGGPYWKKKDDGAWSVPKGELAAGEDELTAARREFEEETGHPAEGDFTELTPLKQPSGKLIHCWAVEGDIDAEAIASNTFTIQWPPHSGRQAEFPEVDRAGWFSRNMALRKILPGQQGFINELCERIGCGPE